MTEFYSFIEHLLYDHECVIIPHFGGFVVNAQGFTFNEREGRIHPKKKCVAFNEKLKTDDRFLSTEWANKKSINLKQASDEIAAFSKDLTTLLIAKGEINFGVLGVFTLNQDKRITFSPNPEFNADLSVFGLFPVGLGHSNPIKVHKPELVPTPVSDDLPEIATEEYNQVKVNKSVYAYAFIAFILAGLGAFFLTDPASNQSQSSLNPINIEKKVAPAPVVAEAKPILDSTKTKIVPNLEVKETTRNNATVIKQTDVIYLVAASFQTLTQAEKGLKEFKSRGFEQAEIILKNENTKFYRISLGTEHSMEAGYAQASELKSTKNVDIWVYKAL